MPAPGDECEVDRLDANLSEAGSIIGLACYRIFREAVDVEGSTPLGCSATVSSRPGRPTGWIELHLHESCPRMPGADRWINDVLITIWRAGAEKFWIRLCVTHRHTEPERGVELEVERFAAFCGVSR